MVYLSRDMAIGIQRPDARLFIHLSWLAPRPTRFPLDSAGSGWRRRAPAREGRSVRKGVSQCRGPLLRAESQALARRSAPIPFGPARASACGPCGPQSLPSLGGDRPRATRGVSRLCLEDLGQIEPSVSGAWVLPRPPPALFEARRGAPAQSPLACSLGSGGCCSDAACPNESKTRAQRRRCSSDVSVPEEGWAHGMPIRILGPSVGLL